MSARIHRRAAERADACKFHYIKCKQSLHLTDASDTIAAMAKSRTSRDPSQGVRKPKTEQRTYRFNAELFTEFEDDCARHLRNPRLVMEALIRHWLTADAKLKGEIAEKHRAWAGNQANEE